MGAWGNGVWQDDGAEDILLAFEDALQGGLTERAALQRILADPPWSWDDEEDSATQLLAIATLALQRGMLEPDLRDRAIAMIDSAVPMWRWEGAPSDRVSAREEVLAQLRVLLARGTATAEELANVTRPEKHSLW